MKERSWLLAWLALAAPLLMLLSLLAMAVRSGSSRVQALPPLLIAAALMLSNAIGRRRGRRRLLDALRRADG